MEDSELDKQKIKQHAKIKQQLQTSRVNRQTLYQQCRLVIMGIIKTKQIDKKSLVQMLAILIQQIRHRIDRLDKFKSKRLVEEQITLFTQCIKAANSYLERQVDRIKLLQPLYSQLINVYSKYCSVLPLQQVDSYFLFYRDLCDHPNYFSLKITQQENKSFDGMICGIVQCFSISLKYNLNIISFNQQSQELLIDYYQNNKPFKRSFKLRTYYHQYFEEINKKASMKDRFQLILKRMLVRLCQEKTYKHNKISCQCKKRCPQIQGYSSFQTQNQIKGCLNKGFRFLQLAYLFFGDRIFITKFRFCCQIQLNHLPKFFQLLQRDWQVIIEQDSHAQLCIQKDKDGCKNQNGKIRTYQQMKYNANKNYKVIKDKIKQLDPNETDLIKECDKFLTQTTSFQPFSIILMVRSTQLGKMLNFQSLINEKYQKENLNRVELVSKFVQDKYKIFHILPSQFKYQSYISNTLSKMIGHTVTQVGNAIKSAFSGKGTQSQKARTVKKLKIQRQQDSSSNQFEDIYSQNHEKTL